MNTEMIFGLAGGLGLFLYGMRTMGDGLQKAAGDRLRRIIEVLTTNRLLGVIVGAVVTALIQSSSATTVMVVGFVNAGLMTLTQAVGVIMGANIGTTVTAQLIAFKLEEYALPAIGLGVLLQFFGRHKAHKNIGQILLGFGLLFMGMEVMKDSMKPLRELAWFTDAMVAMSEHPILGVGAGFALTGLVQSSSATIGILQGLAENGLVSIYAALPILFGDNIGTTVTAMLSSIGASIAARRAALTHFLFNTIGTVIFLILLPVVTPIVLASSIDPVRQVANAHSLFNLANTAIQLPFAGLLVLAVTHLIPGEDATIARPLHLDKRMLNTPSVALEQVRRELVRMSRLSLNVVEEAMSGFFNNDTDAIRRAMETEAAVNQLEKGITQYMVELSRRSLTESQSRELNFFLDRINDIERVGDHGENIADLANYKMEHRLPFSPGAIEDLEYIYAKVKTIFENAIKCLEENDMYLAEKVITQEESIDSVEREMRRAHIRRLNEGTCYPGSGVVFLDLIANFERIADHSTSIADGLQQLNESQLVLSD